MASGSDGMRWSSSRLNVVRTRSTSSAHGKSFMLYSDVDVESVNKNKFTASKGSVVVCELTGRRDWLGGGV